MNLTEFLDELEKLNKNVGWKWRYEGTRLLRGAHVTGVSSWFCPITAVYYAKTCIPYDTAQWIEAAKQLNLPYPTASDIVEAADGTGSPTLRQHMVAKLGLKEKP